MYSAARAVRRVARHQAPLRSGQRARGGAVSCGPLLALLTLAAVQPSIAHAQLTPPKQYTISPTNVNLMDATYTTSVEDLSIGPLSLQRTYLGGPDVSNSYFGYNWTHNFDIWAYAGTFAGQSETKVIIGRKTYAYWGLPDAQTYSQSDEDGTRVTVEGGVMVFRDRDGTTYRFNSGWNSKVASITSPDGSVLRFTYASGKVKTIISSQGYALVFDYGGNGRVSAACAFNRAMTYVTTTTTCASAALKTTYGYSGSNLISATDVSGQTAHYGYTTSAPPYNEGFGLTCETDPGTTTCRVVNEYTAGTYQVKKQTLADGKVWLFGCTCSFMGRGEQVEDIPEDYTGWTDPNGASKSFAFRNYTPTAYLDENGKRYLTSFYGGTLLGIGAPEGNSVSFNLSDRGMSTGQTYAPKPNTGAARINQDVRTYSTTCTNTITCNKPLTIADGKQNVTSFTYDPTHGGVLTATRPADGAGLSAVTRYAYVSRTAWVKNSAGGYVAETPIWLPSEERTCRTTATTDSGACAGGAADEVVTRYEYGPDSGPNTLLPRGVSVSADGLTRRTCYGYDTQGNKISETSPRAGLAACS